MEPWYIELKDRFDWEREALNNQGFSLQSDILENQKRVVFTGVVNVNNKDYKLDIEYPEGFPYFPPECFCQDKDFWNKKHILPNAGKLCLYVDWEDNRNKTGIDILERAKVWIEKTLTDSFSPSEEIDGPEPKQYSLFSVKHKGVLIAPESVYQPDWKGKEGNFTINIQKLSDESNERFLFKGLLTRIHCNRTDLLNERELDLLKQNTREYSGKCFEVDTAPPYFEDQNELVEWLEQQGHKNVKVKCEQASVHLKDKVIRNNPNVEIGALLGIKYKDEVEQKGNYENRFLVVGLKSSKVANKRPLHFPYVVFKSEEISQNKLFKRSPS